MTFPEMVLCCFDRESFVTEFNRLCGCSIGRDKRPALDRAIDEACGRPPGESELFLFISFVYDIVWCRLPAVANGVPKPANGRPRKEMVPA